MKMNSLQPLIYSVGHKRKARELRQTFTLAPIVASTSSFQIHKTFFDTYHVLHASSQAYDGHHQFRSAKMSWSGFKKATSRAGTQLMMKTGHVEKTTDREYEVEERRYRTLEAASLRLQKEAKGYLDSLRAMTASQMRIAETIDAFYGESGARDGVSRSYKQAVEDLDAETVKALDGPYRCVPDDLRRQFFNSDDGEYNEQEISDMERQWNFDSKKRVYTRGPIFWTTEVDVRGADALMDFVYRQTVLEPINRFCAYFPDINECKAIAASNFADEG